MGEIKLSLPLHTHQSPGNFSTSSLYNALASQKLGFDRDLFYFLAERLAGVVQESCRTAEAARLHFNVTRVKGLARNRSIEAFLKNPESDLILSEGVDLPEGILPRIYTQDNRSFHAIDPTLQTLWITSKVVLQRLVELKMVEHRIAPNGAKLSYFDIKPLPAQKRLESLLNLTGGRG